MPLQPVPALAPSPVNTGTPLVADGRHRTAKLTAAAARRIRERWAAPDRPLQRELAAEYGVTVSAVSAVSEVVNGKSWLWAGGPLLPPAAPDPLREREPGLPPVLKP